jgi:hypothetical protein
VLSVQPDVMGRDPRNNELEEVASDSVCMDGRGAFDGEDERRIPAFA